MNFYNSFDEIYDDNKCSSKSVFNEWRTRVTGFGKGFAVAPDSPMSYCYIEVYDKKYQQRNGSNMVNGVYVGQDAIFIVDESKADQIVSVLESGEFGPYIKDGASIYMGFLSEREAKRLAQRLDMVLNNKKS